jgi:hypothetical protein
MADIHLWKAHPSMDRILSNIFPWYDDYPCRDCDKAGNDHRFVPWKPSHRCVFLEVPSKNAVLQVHSLGGKRTEHGLLETAYMISPEFLWGHLHAAIDKRGAGSRDVVQIAWQGGCPTGLCISTPTLAMLFGQLHHTDLELVTITLHPHFGPRIQARYNLEAPREALAVAALAITLEGDPTITWQCQHHLYKFVRYSSVTDLNGTQYLTNTNEATLKSSTVAPDRITHIAIRRNRAMFFPRIFQIPFWVGDIDFPSGPAGGASVFSREETSLPAGVVGVVTPRVGIYLAQRHIHGSWDAILNSDEPCVNGVLKLFISRDKYHINQVVPARQGAYIVRTIQWPTHAKNDTLGYKFVARLANTPSFENLPTNGLKVAVSPRSRRIALAAWRTLRVYSIEPKVFLLPDRSSYNSNDGNAYTYCDPKPIAAWRSGYYNNWTHEEEQVVLEPLELSSTGVIHVLHWTSEYELWALTDEGVCRWNVGVWANAQKTVSELGQNYGDLGLAREKRKGTGT